MRKKLIHSTIWVMLLTGLLAFSIIHPMTATEISDDSSKDTAIEDTDAWRTDGSYDSVYNLSLIHIYQPKRKIQKKTINYQGRPIRNYFKTDTNEG